MCGNTSGLITVTDVSAVDLSSGTEVRFRLGVTLSIAHSFPLDLGLETDDLGLTLADATVGCGASMTLAFEFGVLTSGEDAEEEDFFVEISDLTFAASTPQGGVPLDTGMNIGFLGTEVSGTVIVQADIDAIALISVVCYLEN